MKSQRKPQNPSKLEEVENEDEKFLSLVDEMARNAQTVVMQDAFSRDGDFSTGQLVRLTGGQVFFLFDILWDVKNSDRSHVFPLSKYTQLLPDVEVVKMNVGNESQFLLASVFSREDFEDRSLEDFDDHLFNVNPLNRSQVHAVKICDAQEARRATGLDGHIKYGVQDFDTKIWTFRFVLTSEPDDKNRIIKSVPPSVSRRS